MFLVQINQKNKNYVLFGINYHEKSHMQLENERFEKVLVNHVLN